MAISGFWDRASKRKEAMRWQEWFCKPCRRRGKVGYVDGDLLSVLQLIGKHHGEYDGQRGCTLQSVQVVNEALLTPEERVEIDRLVYVGTMSVEST